MDGGPQGFVGPTDVAVDDDGFIYVADFFATQLVKLNPQGNVVLRWGDDGGPGGEDSPPLGLLLFDDALHVSDPLNGRIQVFDLNGNALFVWPSTGLPGPARLALGPTRRLFVTSADLRFVFVYQAGVEVLGTHWGDVKRLYRTRR